MDRLAGRTEEIYRLVVEHARDLITLADASGTILFASPAWRQLGYEPEDLVGMAATALVDPVDVPVIERSIAAIFERGHVMLPALRIKRGDGGWAYLEVTAVRIEDEEGGLIVSTARDMSDRASLDLERDQLLERERAAREAADSARARLELLLRVSSALSRSLDFERALDSLGRLIVGSLADICLIDVLEPDGSIRRVTAVHRDPAQQALLDELIEHYSPAPTGRHPASEVLSTGVPTTQNDMTDEFLRATTRDERHYELVKRLGFSSNLRVPLRAGGATLGVLTLCSTDATHRYEEPDVQLAAELARRAAVAVANARTFTTQAHAAEQDRRLLRMSEVMSEPRLKELMQGLLTQLTTELGSEQSVLLLREPEREILRIGWTVGLDERHVPAATEIAFGQGLAGRVAVGGEPIVVEDVGAPGALGSFLFPDARSIVAVPLIAEGVVVGVLQTSGPTPRSFDREDLEFLGLVADRAALAIQRAQLYEREHQIASLLQRSLLPANIPQVPGLDVAVRFHAAGLATEVGGDFYDVFRTDECRWAIAIGDVCGRGPAAAAVTGLIRHSLRAFSLQGTSPGEVLALINDTMLRSDVDRFCTVALAQVEVGSEGHRLTLTRAGHPYPLIRRSSGSIEVLETDGIALGLFPDIRFEETTMTLEPHDSLLMYTDGLIERGRGRPTTEVEKAYEAAAASSAEEMAETIDRTMNGDDEVDDDVALLVGLACPTDPDH
jgi:PAS domain S-box-containing protein